MTSKHSYILQEENGFAALIIAIVILVVLSLITLGFAYQMRQEQRTALDNQLASQANYAAESAINDAVKFLSTNTLSSKTTCAPSLSGEWSAQPGGFYATYPQTISNTIAFTCLLVNPNVHNIYVNGISPGQYAVVPLSSTGSNIGYITIRWQNSDGSNPPISSSCSNSSQPPYLPTNSSNDPWGCQVSLVEANIVSQSSIQLGNSQTAADTAMTAYLYPNDKQSLAYVNLSSPSGGPMVISANVINGVASETLKVPAPDSTFYLRLTPFYGNSATNFTISVNDANNIPLSTNSAQVEIDATGKATDILKRIAARYPTGIKIGYDSFALQSSGPICKQFEIIPQNNGGTGIPTPGPNIPASSTDCGKYGY